MKRIEKYFSGKAKISFLKNDFLSDLKKIESFLTECNVNDVIHFAGYKSVEESKNMPEKYWYNNFIGSYNFISLLKELSLRKKTQINFIFSSTATVYKSQNKPLVESGELKPNTPYAATKLAIENYLDGVANNYPSFKAISLRYFNPVGANNLALTFENPLNEPSNLMPILINKASENLPIKVYGEDYDTPDGTCIRDYIHVVDLIDGHKLALSHLKDGSMEKNEKINLGTGKGTSVHQMIDVFKDVNNLNIEKVISERRPGDVPTLVASVKKAEELLGFSAKKNLKDMCKDSWEVYNSIKKSVS